MYWLFMVVILYNIYVLVLFVRVVCYIYLFECWVFFWYIFLVGLGGLWKIGYMESRIMIKWLYELV